MVHILPFLGRDKEPDKREKKVSFLATDDPTTSREKPKRRNSLLCSNSNSNTKRPRSPNPFKPPRHKASLVSIQDKAALSSSQNIPAAQAQKSRFEIATEILAQDQGSEIQFWQKQMEEARQRFYGVEGARPRYGWESPNKSKPSDTPSEPTSNANSRAKNNSSRSKRPHKLGNLRGLGRSQSLDVTPPHPAENSPTASTREVWNTLYSKNQEINSLRLSHQEMLEELHAHQVGLRAHKRALDEARWESEECYQTLSLLNKLASEGKHFDEKVWMERTQLRNRIRQLEQETRELKVKWEQCQQMLDRVDAIWFEDWKEKEELMQELQGARAENKRLNVRLDNVCEIGGQGGPGSQLERSDSSRDGGFYDAQERAEQAQKENGSRKSSPGRREAEGPRIPPRISSLHWQNLARSASARQEEFKKEERSRSTSMPKPSAPLELPQAQFEEDRSSPQPDQVWWTQLYGWPCYTRVLTV